MGTLFVTILQISLWPQDVHEYILLLLLLAFIPHEVVLESISQQFNIFYSKTMTNGGSMVSEFQAKISDLLYKYLADKWGSFLRIQEKYPLKWIFRHVKCPELASSRFGKAIECVSLCEVKQEQINHTGSIIPFPGNNYYH